MPSPQRAASETLGARVLGGTARLASAQALLPLTGLITAAVLTRYLGPDGYGLFTLAATLVVLFEFTIGALLGNATVHLVASAKDSTAEIRAILRLYLLMSVAAAASLWVLAPALASLWNEPGMTPTLRLFALDVPIVCMARGYACVLAGRQRFGQQARAIAGRWIARLILTVTLVVMGFSIHGAVVATIVASLVELAIVCRKGVTPALRRPPAAVPGLWALAGPIFLSTMGIRVLGLDLMFLKALGASATEAGYYGAATNLAAPPVMIAAAASAALLATLSRGLHGGEHRQAHRVMGVAIRLLLVSIPVAAMISGCAETIITLVYGAGFAPAGPPFGVLIFSSAGLVAVHASTASMIAAGHARLTLVTALLVAPCAIVGYLIFVPHYASMGVAVVTTAVAVGAGFMSLGVAMYCWRQRPPVFTLLRSVVLGGVYFWGSSLWQVDGLWVVAKLLVLAASLPLAYALLGEFSAADRSGIRWLFQRRGSAPPTPSLS